MRNLHFKDYFWNGELISTGGYDINVLMRVESLSALWTPDYGHKLASIEEKYAKDLLGLSKKVCGHNEMNTLKRSLDMFKLQIEHVSLSHLHLAQTMREEAKRLEDFRERQRDARKKIEQQLDALHKQKASQFKKTMESKKTYEQKCRDKEEADQNVNRNTNSKHIEKLYTKAQQSKQNAEEADRIYLHNVTTLGKIREEWLKEHTTACEIFEKQTMERINVLRNTVWTHLNHLSQQCVTSDELYEEVRKSLEQCDIQEDIGHFVNLRRTGDKPPAPVMYENFYSGQRSPMVAPPPRQPPPISRRAPLPNPANNNNREDDLYSTVQEPGYSLIHY
ncbi:proline-serine-threonine phosphatase-interacting protein 2 [Diretmus argenteus]